MEHNEEEVETKVEEEQKQIEIKEDKREGFKLPVWFGIAIFILILMNINMSNHINSLKSDIFNLKSDVSGISGSFYSSQQNNLNQIEALLNKRQSLVNDFTFEISKFQEKRVDVLFNVKPKEYASSDKLYFICKIGNSTQTIEAKTTDKVNFTGKIGISVFDNVDIDLLIDNGKVRKTEKLGSIERPINKLKSRIHADSPGSTYSYNEKEQVMNISQEFSLMYETGQKDSLYLKDVKLIVEVNGKTVTTKPMETNQDTGLKGYYSLKLTDFIIPCISGDTEKMVITAKDNLGFNYKIVVQSGIVNQNSIIMTQDNLSEINRVEIN